MCIRDVLFKPHISPVAASKRVSQRFCCNRADESSSVGCPPVSWLGSIASALCSAIFGADGIVELLFKFSVRSEA